jgi:hypothetical protein
MASIVLISGALAFGAERAAAQIVIDGSSEESFHATFSAIRFELPEELHGRFITAAIRVVARGAGYPMIFPYGGDPFSETPQQRMQHWLDALNGKTASDIMAESDAIPEEGPPPDKCFMCFD